MAKFKYAIFLSQADSECLQIIADQQDKTISILLNEQIPNIYETYNIESPSEEMKEYIEQEKRLKINYLVKATLERNTEEERLKKQLWKDLRIIATHSSFTEAIMKMRVTAKKYKNYYIDNPKYQETINNVIRNLQDSNRVKSFYNIPDSDEVKAKLLPYEKEEEIERQTALLFNLPSEEIK